MEFPELETHCSRLDCQQVDFLPFECDCCKQIFCLEHRTYQSHNCTASGSKDSQALVCPICLKGVKLLPGEDPNITFHRHSAQDCDPKNYKKVTTKPKCPVKGCGENLTLANTVQCRDCNIKVCLKHRFPADHSCRNAAASSARGQPNSNFLRALEKRLPQGGAGAGGQQHQTQTQTQASSASRAAAPRPGSGTTQRQLQPKVGGPNRGPPAASQYSGAGTGSEECPQCGARFRDVEQLIRHVEEYHPPPGGSQASNPMGGATSTGREICPQCGKSFPTLNEMIAHAEKAHKVAGSKSSSDCCIQ